MIVRRFLLKVPLAIGEANCFVAYDEGTKEALLVDAGMFDQAVADYVSENGLQLKQIFVTHDHADHTQGLPDLAKHFGAQVIAGVENIEGVQVDRVVQHGDTLAVGALEGYVVSTPGHTPVAFSLVFPGVVFSGDALFAGAVGGTGSQEDYDLQIGSIREHLLTLPDETEVHSGHGPATRIGIEKKYNPFFV